MQKTIPLKTALGDILKAYGDLLSSVDAWFARSMAEEVKNISCARGCSRCCRGLFDITLLDAFFLKCGFDQLPAEQRKNVLEQAEARYALMRVSWPDMEAPYILNLRPEKDWEILMPDDDETPCPLLGNDGACIVYQYRPMTCRLHGLPLIDLSGEIFHDEWCTMNFSREDPLQKQTLRWEFRKCFQDELLIFREFTELLFERKINELDTFIPTALLIDFEGFDWKRWWWENAGRVMAEGSAGHL